MNAQAMWLEDGSPEQQERDATMKAGMEAQKEHFDEGLVRILSVLLCVSARTHRLRSFQMKDVWEETAEGV